MAPHNGHSQRTGLPPGLEAIFSAILNQGEPVDLVSVSTLDPSEVAGMERLKQLCDEAEELAGRAADAADEWQDAKSKFYRDLSRRVGFRTRPVHIHIHDDHEITVDRASAIAARLPWEELTHGEPRPTKPAASTAPTRTADASVKSPTRPAAKSPPGDHAGRQGHDERQAPMSG